ncbi:MAG: GtrA family protein [Microbacteriaceae bacterium]|nr:GtrA family protein [Microbacteriaceae bacterium]
MPAPLRRLLADERARFVVIGGINTIVAYGLFAAFEAAFGGRYLLSLLLSYLVATMLAFVLHRRVTFAVSGRASLVADFLRFESVYVVMLAANAVLLPVLVELAGWSSLAAQAAIIVVTTIVSYLGHKFFSFRRP